MPSETFTSTSPITASLVAAVLLLFPLLIAILFWPYMKWRLEGEGVDKQSFESSIPSSRKPVRLTVVVPAFNEELRLTSMLQDTISYLTDRKLQDPKYSWEIIVVDDGSTDRTYELAQSFYTDETPVFALRSARNVGKGGAVRMGVLRAVGDFVLMADADGATRITDLDAMEKSAMGETAVVFGSRDHLRSTEAVAARHPVRNVLMRCFHVAVYLIVGTHIRDTQCGFKLFGRRAANAIFRSMHLRRWAFDIEIVLLCRQMGFAVEQVDVNWTEIPGSKLNVVLGSLQMLRDMTLVRLLYAVGVWAPLDSPTPSSNKSD